VRTRDCRRGVAAFTRGGEKLGNPVDARRGKGKPGQVSDCGDDRGRPTCDGHEPAVGREGARRRPGLLAACAAFVVAVALGFPGSGCLNPRPEELPSADFGAPGTPPPVRDTCDDHPLLGDCDLPAQDINGEPLPSGSSEDEAAPRDPAPVDVDANGASGPSAPGEEAGAGGGGGDAGSDSPADAGAP
jgi:hypothetical protein